MSKYQERKEFIVNLLYFAAIGGAVFIAFKLLFSLMLPFITAFVIASSSRKAVSFIASKTKLSGKAACAVFTSLLIFLISSAVFFLFYRLFRELTSLSGLLEDNTISVFFEDTLGGIYSLIEKILPSSPSFSATGIISTLNGILDKAADSAIDKLLSVSVSFIKFFPSAVIFIVFTVLSLYYIGFDYDKIVEFLRLQLSKKLLTAIDESISVFTLTLKRIFKAYVLLTFITFIQLLCGFFVLGIRYSLITSLAVCLVDLIPVLGTGTVLLPWSVFSFISGDVGKGTGLIIIYALITVFRQIAEPKIVGANIGLSPLLSLIAMYAGLKAFGFFGVIIFPIVMITVISLNEKGIIRLYKSIPETKESHIHKSRHKFLSFKKQDKG